MYKRFRELWYDEEAAATVEYALLLSGLIVGGASVWQVLKTAIADAVNNAANTISSVGSTPVSQLSPGCIAQCFTDKLR